MGQDAVSLDKRFPRFRRNEVDCVWNVMAHAQKPDFVFRRKGRVHVNRREGGQYSRLLAGELCTSACRVCTARASLCSAVMWHLLVTHSILLFPLHFSFRASPCAITFQTQSTCFYLQGSGGPTRPHDPWRWRYYVSSQRCESFTQRWSVVFQKI
jgi:hypothetical protein